MLWVRGTEKGLGFHDIKIILDSIVFYKVLVSQIFGITHFVIILHALCLLFIGQVTMATILDHLHWFPVISLTEFHVTAGCQ